MCRGLWVCGRCLGPLCPSLSTRARNTCTNSKLAPPSLAAGPYQPPSPGCRPPEPDSTNLRDRQGQAEEMGSSQEVPQRAQPLGSGVCSIYHLPHLSRG